MNGVKAELYTVKTFSCANRSRAPAGLFRPPTVKLLQIPETLAELKSLTNLNLGRNSISCLPKVVNSLSGLASLDISHNRLKIAEILQTGRKQRGLRLVSLERLKLQNNELTEGPTAADTLTTLTELE